jgi:hypothetical protein
MTEKHKTIMMKCTHKETNKTERKLPKHKKKDFLEEKTQKY